MMRVARHWTWLVSEVVDALSLEEFKISFYGALSNLM